MPGNSSRATERKAPVKLQFHYCSSLLHRCLGDFVCWGGRGWRGRKLEFFAITRLRRFQGIWNARWELSLLRSLMFQSQKMWPCLATTFGRKPTLISEEVGWKRAGAAPDFLPHSKKKKKKNTQSRMFYSNMQKNIYVPLSILRRPLPPPVSAWVWKEVKSEQWLRQRCPSERVMLLLFCLRRTKCPSQHWGPIREGCCSKSYRDVAGSLLCSTNLQNKLSAGSLCDLLLIQWQFCGLGIADWDGLLSPKQPFWASFFFFNFCLVFRHLTSLDASVKFHVLFSIV